MIFQCLEHCESNRRKQVNAESSTDAQGWASILSAFTKEGTPPPKITDFLPYPIDDKEADRRISRRTGKILIQLEREQKFPPNFLAEITQFITEAEALEKR